MKPATLLLIVLAPACATSAPGAQSAAPPATTAHEAPRADAPALEGGGDVDALVGKPAPDFTATTYDGKSIHMAALRGKWAVVYFYPKDETPGCTKEACSFRDAWVPIAATGATLIGISADDSASHREFAEHYKLPFVLLSDPDGAIAKSYLVPFTGHHRRQTIVVGPDGTVRKVYRSVDVTVHAAQIAADLGAADRSN
jgi:peroxiredoxin Q/BCP